MNYYYYCLICKKRVNKGINVCERCKNLLVGLIFVLCVWRLMILSVLVVVVIMSLMQIIQSNLVPIITLIVTIGIIWYMLRSGVFGMR